MIVTPASPAGFSYYPDLITTDEERALVAAIESLPLAAVVMRGFTARRRTLHYGVVYGYNGRGVTPGPPFPEFLLPLRARAAAIGSVDDASLTEALVTEYVAGAVIGWHRDAPMFGPTVIGISLVSACAACAFAAAAIRHRAPSNVHRSCWSPDPATFSRGRRAPTGSTVSRPSMRCAIRSPFAA